MSEGFLSRWSRAKRGLAPAEPPAEPPAETPDGPAPPASPEAMAAPPAAPLAAPLAEAPPAEEEFDLSTLPDLETATESTDFTAFLKKGVPAELKQAALRRAWSVDPGIRDFIGPADYAWDFNLPDGVPGFALSLGGDIAKMVAQAIGQIEKIADSLEGAEAPSFLPPGIMAPAPMPTPLSDPPAEPARLLAEAPPALPVPAHVVEEAEPAPPPRRRHGGALPG